MISTASAPAPEPRRDLDADGRCCRRRPLIYKRPPHLFCPRCDRSFSSVDGQQIQNWAWKQVKPDLFLRIRGSAQ